MKSLISLYAGSRFRCGSAVALLLLASVVQAKGDDPKISDILKHKSAPQAAAKTSSTKPGKQAASGHKTGVKKSKAAAKRTTILVKKDPKQAAELARLKKEKAAAEQREAEARRQAAEAQNGAETAQKQATADREARQAAEDKARQLQDSIARSQSSATSKADEDGLTASQLINKAYASLCRNQLGTSVRQARKAIAKNSSSANAHAMLANALLEDYMLRFGDDTLREAREEAERAYDLNAKCALALTALAYIRTVDDKPDEARTLIHQASRLSPKLAYIFNQQGCLDTDNADKIANFKRAIELDPDIAWAHANLALVYTEQNQATEAADELKALRQQNELDFWLCLGGIALARKGWNTAEECFRKAIAIKPDYCAGYAPLAIALLAQGDKEGAREQAGLAKKRGVIHNPVYKLLGME